MRFVIVCPGALGSVIGAVLARGNHEVSLLGRPSPHLPTIRDHGLRLVMRKGGSELLSIAATDDPAIVGQTGTAIVLVKSGDTASAMRAIRPPVHAGQTLLTLQNGIGNAQWIRAELGEGPRILAGVTSQAATRLPAGSVAHTGEDPTIIGFTEEQDASTAAELAPDFSAAGLPSVSVPDIERWVRRKAAVNSAINGLTALGGFPNRTIATDSHVVEAAVIISEEAARVSRAQGIELGGMRRAILESAAATHDNRSSMLQDLDAHRLTEVEAIHGAIKAAGERVRVATPAIHVLAALIRAKERTFSPGEQIDG